MRSIRTITAAAVLAAAVPFAVQAETFATTTFTAIRGTVPGDFPGWYGGSLGGGYPVALTEAQARASVLGAPDNAFVSLPGVANGVPGTAFQGAYIEVGFGANFSSDNILTIYETGDNQEQAQLFIWSDNGGNVQPSVITNASGVITLDLRAYASILSLLGGTAWTKIGIGGLDQNGASQGFDLDAVSITAVPEPSTSMLLLGGLVAVASLARRRLRG